MLLHSGDHLFVALTLTDHAGLTLGDHSGTVGVHTVSGGGTGRANSFTGTGGGGAYKVDDAILHIHGKLFTRCHQLTQAFVSSVTGGIDHTGDQTAVAGLQRPGNLAGQRCFDRNCHIKAPPSYVLQHGS